MELWCLTDVLLQVNETIAVLVNVLHGFLQEYVGVSRAQSNSCPSVTTGHQGFPKCLCAGPTCTTMSFM